MTNLILADFLLPEFEFLPQWLLGPFIVISIFECITGVIGNLLVILIILCLAKSNITQTSHHCFIVNLALSDFVLCLFTMPLNIYRSFSIYMTFPPAFCKLADSFPAINIYVSSLTIVAISIYRYVVVCYPYKKKLGICSTIIIMISIWLLAIAAASPLFIYSRSIPAYDESLIDSMVDLVCNQSTIDSCEVIYSNEYKRLHVCHESWPSYGELRLLYTIFMLFLQFILPILIICITYYRVIVRLRERFRYRFIMKRHNLAALRQEIRRQRRNNVLLLLIVSLYAISWLPFNISYILITYSDHLHTTEKIYSVDERKSNDLSKYLPLRFLICMISAISNPFLYSYFNETFKNDLRRTLSCCCPRFNREINQIPIDQIDNITNKMKTEKTSFNNTLISEFSQNTMSTALIGHRKHSLTFSRPNHDQSTRLTITISNHCSSSISSHI